MGNDNLSKRELNFELFLQSIKNGNQNILELINRNESDFNEATFEQLMSNEDDVLVGVNKVLFSPSENYFDTFDYSLIKTHDNGDVKYIFHSIVIDVLKVKETYAFLVKVFGEGTNNPDKSLDFTDINIENIANNYIPDSSLDILHSWNYKNLGILLQYRGEPLYQFSLMLTIKAPTIIDKSIRRNGTILDLLNLDLNTFFYEKELTAISVNGNKNPVIIDYTFIPEVYLLETFDRVEIRIFSNERVFNKKVTTHVTLYSSNELTYLKKIKVIDKILNLYGQDNSGSKELAMYELDILDKNEYWVGRTYRFNESHGLRSDLEAMSYDVTIDDTKDEQGFKIHIFAFNQLVDLFGID